MVTKEPRLPTNDTALEAVQAFGVAFLDQDHDGSNEPDDSRHYAQERKDERTRDAVDEAQEGGADRRVAASLNLEVDILFGLLKREAVGEDAKVRVDSDEPAQPTAHPRAVLFKEPLGALL